MSETMKHALFLGLDWAFCFICRIEIPLMLVGIGVLFSGMIRKAIRAGRLGDTITPRPVALPLAFAVALLPAGFWFWSVWLSLERPDFFLRMAGEDSPMEYAQTLCLLLGFVCSVMIARKLWRSGFRVWCWCYTLFAIALFWTAGEEISWGQRLFRIATPEWFEAHNVQQEMNVHNLGNVDDILSICMDAILLHLILVTILFRVTGVDRVKRLHSTLWLPHPSLLPTWGCVISYGAVFQEEREIPEAVSQLQEPRELILYVGLLVFLMIVLYNVRGNPKLTETVRGS